MTRAFERSPGLVRGLGAWDTALITVGTMLGSSIFIGAALVPRALSHPALVLSAWIVGGLLTIAGALTYAELGAMFPRAGGQYHFLKEAFGPFSGFMFGWASFLVAQSAANAYVAVAFGEYVGAFIPGVSTTHAILAVPIGPWTWRLNAVQVVGAVAIAVLTAINYLGLKEGAGVQNVLTVLKGGAVLLLCVAGFAVPARTAIEWFAPLPTGNLAAGIGVALVGVFGAYDGWYQATFVAGEIRDPERNLPRGILGGVVAMVLLYTLVNVTYLRALPLATLGASPRIGESAALALLGPTGGRLMALAVILVLLGCLSSGILTAARIYLPMAQDGVFFHVLDRIHPVHRVPTASLVAQGMWSVVLALLGTYENLLGYVVFVLFLFHAATGVALFRLRRERPGAPRPYRTWGYPWVPLLFVLTSLGFVINALVTNPRDSCIGVAIVALGAPAYWWWRRGAPRVATGLPEHQSRPPHADSR
jgi:basic amino acid/polyamine antiporter, APA family